MSELEDKLNSILNSPEQMSRIMQLAKSFSGSEQPPRDDTPPPSSDGIDPRLLKVMMQLMREYSSSTGKDSLISAMKPYLSEKRRDKIDKAAKIARLAKVAKTAFSEMGGDPFV